MSKFYTGRGDDGSTGLLGEGRIDKDHPLIQALGAIDEASAALGLARSLSGSGSNKETLLSIQRDLYHLMAELAATPDNVSRFRVINTEKVAWLEEQIRNLEATVQPPGDFIIPGDTTAGAALDMARTIVRRAERCLVRLTHEGSVENIELPRYLNRLSSLCFVLELSEIQIWGVERPTFATD